MEFYLFNPEHDMALASFSPYYKAPTEIIRMRNDLAGLPVWYASKDAQVWVDSSQYTADFMHQCVFEGLHLYGKCWDVKSELPFYLSANVKDNPVKVPYSEGQSLVPYDDTSSELVISPWGWDPALVSYWKKNGVSDAFLPDSGQLERIHVLSGRQQCVKILADFEGWDQVCGEASVCSTLDQVRDFLATHADVILKAPWSGSGRGLTRTSLTTWTVNLEGWVSRILRTQGSIMAEPIYNKVVDFAMEFEVDPAHQLRFAGYSLFETDTHGNYKENVLTSNQRILTRLAQYVPVDLIEKVKAQLLLSLSALLGTDYMGYFGVDMMICEVDGLYCIHPCVEINLRMNMGVVARLLYDRYMSVQTEGSYVVEHYSKDGEAVEHDRQLRELHPSCVSSGKMLEGYFPLTPVTSTTRYQCYVICHQLCTCK